MRAALIYVLLLFCSNLFGQVTISGKIALDSSDARDAPGFIIELLDSSNKLVAGTLDSNSLFSFSAAISGTYHLRLRSIIVAQYKDVDTTLNVNDSAFLNLELRPMASCAYYNEEKARKDIASNTIILVVKNGSPPDYTREKERFIRKFQRRYHVKYEGGGCLVFDNNSCVLAYNKVVFRYLDNRYGYKWRKKVSNSVMGITHN